MFFSRPQIVIRPAVISCCSVPLLFIRPCEGTKNNAKCQMNLAFFEDILILPSHPHILPSNPYVQGIWRREGEMNVPHITLTFWVTSTPIAKGCEGSKQKKWGRREGEPFTLTCHQSFIYRCLRLVMWKSEGHLRIHLFLRSRYQWLAFGLP